MSVDETKLIDSLKQILRQSSLLRWEACSQNSSFEIREIEGGYKEGKVYANRISLILLAGNNINITIKMHFDNSNIKKLSSGLLSKKANEVSDTQACDFVKEFCNLMAGHIKKVFEDHDIHVESSLPISTRGLYQVYVEDRSVKYETTFNDGWYVLNDDMTFVCSVVVELIDSNHLGNILTIDLDSLDEEDEVEFL